jgi:glyoxylase-like metal-dependent hydrolase (beta-lactamase superfamily II)
MTADAPPPPAVTKQEQAEATDEIVEVAPGVVRTQLPISMPGLGHVNCYVLEDDRGFAVIDPGLPGDESWSHLLTRMGQAGVPLHRIHSVIVTHSHPDHFGGAARLREETGADIVTHRSFSSVWAVHISDDADVEYPAARPTPWGGVHAGPPPEVRERYIALQRQRRFFPTPTVRLEDAETVSFARREWVAVHTPGHTADHLCLFDPAEGVLLSGDHVLPTITPHIGALQDVDDSLAAFFASLDKVAALDDRTSIVLPAHGKPFTGLGARTEAIKEHHLERLDRLRSAAADLGRPATVMEFATHLFSARAQGPMADSETYAHLEHLRILGHAEARHNGEYLEYAVG